MNNDKNWGYDAPQDQDKWEVNEVQQESVPHYGHYQMHRGDP